MIRKAKEGNITWFPGLTLADIPHPMHSGISTHMKDKDLGLEIQGVVGTVPLLNGDTLQITPKIGQINFLRLLFKAEGCLNDLEGAYNEFVEYSIDDEENIGEIVARQLFYCVDEILKRSPQHGRIHCRHVGIFVLGQIDPVATALNIARRSEEAVVYSTKDKTENIVENRVITEAIIRAWPMLDDSNRIGLSKIYDRWIKRFTRSRNLADDLEIIEKRFAISNYGGSRGYYRKALMLSNVILRSSGIGFDETVSIEGDAVLINTADIFEKYLRNVISVAYSDTGYIVTKGGVGTTSLYSDGSFELVPDIVISKNNCTLLIADAKYKVPTASDHYQITTYLNANGVNRGLLLSPNFDSDEIKTREFATSNKLIVREVHLPMINLDITEEFLGALVENFSQ